MKIVTKQTIREWDMREWFIDNGYGVDISIRIVDVIRDGHTATISKKSLKEWIENVEYDLEIGQIDILKCEKIVLPLKAFSKHIEKILKDFGLTGNEELIIIT